MFLARSLRAISVIIGMSLVAGTLRAATPEDDLIAALALPEVVAVMREEGIAYGRDLEADMFPGQGGDAWAATVAGIYATDRLLPAFTEVFSAELVRSEARIPAMLAFFQTETGRKAIALELSARRALLDEAVEEAAMVRLDELRAAQDPRLADIDGFIAANNLIETNVTGGLNASLAFYTGMSEAGAFGEPLPESEILSDVWGQEPGIRAETEDWVRSFLVMAFAPLTNEELAAYTEFSRSPEGLALNAALFAGFDAVFTDVSGRMGRAVAVYVAGQSL